MAQAPRRRDGGVPEGSMLPSTRAAPSRRAPTPPIGAERDHALEQVLRGLEALGLVEPAAFAGTVSPPKTCRLCVYDLETTGLGRTEDIGIVELGAVVVGYTEASGWKRVASLHKFSVPKTRVQNGVPHGHTRESMTNLGYKAFQDAAMPEFEAFLIDHNVDVLVAHNGRRYDHRIMCFHGFQPPEGMLAADSLDWFKDAAPKQKSYSLGKLYPKFVGRAVPAAHNALPDCLAVIALMNSMPKITPDLCKTLAEPWEAIVARCIGKRRVK